MRAATLRAFNRPLALEERPTPEPGPGQALVRVEASGLCHMDIHVVRGDWPSAPTLPLVPGHEGVGIVERVGAGAGRLREGDRVAVPWLGWACGRCDLCLAGQENLCPERESTGFSRDGAWASHVLANADYLAAVPDGIDPFEAAPLACAGLTAYHAVRRAGVGPSDLVAVFGVGGVGHLAIQYARVAGAEAVAVDLFDDKLALARELGALEAVSAQEDDPAERIQALGGADAAIVVAASARACEQAYASLAPAGRLVLVAFPMGGEMRLPVGRTVAGGLRVLGSLGGTRLELRQVFALHGAGRTRVRYERRPLADVNHALRQLEAGQVEARVVFDPS